MNSRVGAGQDRAGQGGESRGEAAELPEKRLEGKMPGDIGADKTLLRTNTALTRHRRDDGDVLGGVGGVEQRQRAACRQRAKVRGHAAPVCHGASHRGVAAPRHPALRASTSTQHQSTVRRWLAHATHQSSQRWVRLPRRTPQGPSRSPARRCQRSAPAAWRLREEEHRGGGQRQWAPRAPCKSANPQGRECSTSPRHARTRT